MTTISPVSAERVSRPSVARAMRERPFATILATGLGVGFAPIAPGTAGSLLALAAGWLSVASLSSHMPSVVAAVGLLTSGLVIGAIAIPVTGRVAAALAAEDPGCIVLDEIAGQLIASSVVPLVASPSPRLAAVPWIASFLAFRLFDVWKPGPIRGWQRLPGGLGIVVDDAAAGVLAAVLTAVLSAVIPNP
jgi:phosphatidylglycerophosphatase A